MGFSVPLCLPLRLRCALYSSVARSNQGRENIPRSLPRTIKQLKTLDCVGEASVQGWIKSIRRHKNVSFIALDDGSDSEGMQLVLESSNATELYIIFM